MNLYFFLTQRVENLQVHESDIVVLSLDIDIPRGSEDLGLEPWLSSPHPQMTPSLLSQHGSPLPSELKPGDFEERSQWSIS